MAKKAAKAKKKKKVAGSPCPWNANNLACSNTNGVLNGMEEIRSRFSDTKNIKMDALDFWIQGSVISPEQKDLNARALAGRLDRLFRKLLGAKYEKKSSRADSGKYSRSTAIEEMAAILRSQDRTVCELAVAVDKVYRFRGEG